MLELFKGVNNVSNIIEIVEVTINKDYSHATALWKSELIESFLKTVKEKHGEDKLRQIKAEYYRAKCEREPTYRVHLRDMEKRRYHLKKLEGIPKEPSTRPRGKPRKYEPLLRTDASSTAPAKNI
jgi:hypothetical protein